MGKIGPIVAKRILQGVLVAWAVSTLCFVLTVSLPGDLALRVALARYGEDITDQQVVEQIRSQEGLDQSLASRYLNWLNDTMHLDLGRSLDIR